MIVEQDEVCGRLGDITSTLAHRNTDIGLSQCRGVVDTIAGHCDDVAALAQHTSDTQLLARGHTSDNRALLAVQAGGQVAIVSRQLACVEYHPTLPQQPDLAGHRSCCARMIPSDHRDFDVGRTAGSQCLGDVWSGRALEPDQGQHPQRCLAVALGLAWAPATLGHCQDTAAARGEIVDDIMGNRTQTPAQDGFRCAEGRLSAPKRPLS